MTDQEYRNKIEHRISNCLDHSSTADAHAVHEKPGSTRKVWLGLAAMVFLALGYIGYGRLISTDEVLQVHQTEIHEIAIAILPLSTKGEDASTQFYATDLVDNLRSQFRRVPGVSIRAHTSSQAVLSAGFDLPTIVKKLTVQHVIQGSLELAGSDLAISLSIADESGEIRWSQQFHTTSDDIETTQVEVASAIAQHLGLRITPTNSNKVITSYSPLPDMEAHRLFLRVMQTGTGGKAARDA